MRKTAIALAVAFLGSSSLAALAVESPGQAKKDYDAQSAKDYAPGQIKGEDDSARDVAPGRSKDESAKMGESAGTKSGDQAKTSKDDTQKIDQPERRNPTQTN